MLSSHFDPERASQLGQPASPPWASDPPARKNSHGCLRVLAVILMLPVLAIGSFIAYRQTTPNTIRGDFLAALPVLAPDGRVRLWVYTDRSINYSYKKTTGGSTKSGVDCFACESSTYIYDPENAKVDAQFDTKHGGRVPKPILFNAGPSVWIISPKWIADAPHLQVRNAATGALELELPAFCQQHPELQAGVADLEALTNPDRIKITTKDAQTLMYSVADGQLSPDEGKPIQLSEDPTTMVVLSGKSGEKRQSLYLVTGPLRSLRDPEHAGSYASDPEQARFFLKATSEPLLPGKFFIEPLMLYQDHEIAVVLHQAILGDDSDRLLTCADHSGKVRWIAPQSALFDKTRVRAGDSFSSMFFKKSEFSGRRIGSTFLFEYKGIGIIGFDVATGQPRWRLEP